MSEYTNILVYEWNKYGEKIKEFFRINKLEWNSDKIKKLTNEELKNEYTKFGANKDLIIDETMTGSSGIYENKDKSIAIKIIKTENADTVLIIYKGIEGNFYKDLIIRCRDIGCLISKIVDDEVIFKNRLNVRLLKSLNDISGEKNVKIENFIEKMSMLERFNEIYSQDFKSKWIECLNV